MEFISGGTLQSKIDYYQANNTLFDLDLLNIWSLDLVEGMRAINAELLHRDVKPDNILVDGNHLKISDFGISKIVDALTRTSRHTFKGGQNLLYMAPEAWRFEKNTIQLDMYSIGIVLYQMASLKYPYTLPTNPNPSAFQEMHMLQRPISLRNIRNDLPVLFYQIVDRLLTKNPDDRFPNWQEVLDMLQKAWINTSNAPLSNDGLLMNLVDTFGKRYDEKNKEKLEQQQKQAAKAEIRKIDNYQWDQLGDRIDAVISQINQANPVAQLIVDRKAGRILITLPLDAGNISLQPFDVEPPIVLRKHDWTIRYACYLEAPKKLGLNFLLCRKSAEDIYGEWVALSVEMSPLVPTRKHSPFGFENNVQLQQELRASDEAMHVYNVRFSDDIEQKLLELLQKVMDT